MRIRAPHLVRHRLLRHALVCGAVASSILGACGERITGPAARYQLGPIRFVVNAADPDALLPPGTVVLRLYNSRQRLVADTLVAVADGTESLPLSLTIRQGGDVGRYAIEARIVGLAGDTLFATSRVPVPLWGEAETNPPPVELPLQYVGPGANAAEVRILDSPRAGFTGDTLVLAAEVRNAQGAVITGVPLEWLTSDGTRARIVARNDGRFVLGSLRGTATIRARTYSNVVTSTTLGVQPLPSTVQVVGSAAVQGEVASSITGLRVRVLASDGQAVRGIGVSFAAPSGGLTVGTPTTLTDSLGEASTEASLLTVSGAYAVVATPTRGTGQATIAVTANPGPADTLTVTGNPAGTYTAGALLPALQASVKDRFGNNARDTVTLAILDSSLTVVGALRVKSPVSGSVNFNDVQVTKAGSGFTLRLRVAALAQTTATSFAVVPGAPAVVGATGTPTGSVVAGETIPPFDVTVQDAFANSILSFAGNVVASLTGSTGDTLRGTTARPLVSGVATFNDLSAVKAAAGYRIALTVGSVSGQSGAFSIVPAAATQLVVVTNPPASLTAGDTIRPLTVESQDPFGNRSSSTALVTASLASNPTADSLRGTTQRPLVAGSVAFTDLSLRKAGSGYALALASDGLAPDTVANLSVVAGQPSLLSFATAPQSNTLAGAPFPSFVVNGADAFLNPANGNVTLSLENNASGADLLGTLSRPLVAGVATFDDIAIGLPGSTYVLRATAAPGVTTATGAITITPPVIDTQGDVIVSSDAATCARSDQGSGYCWGTGFGADSGSAPVSVATPFALSTVPAVQSVTALGTGQRCLLTTAGAAHCISTAAPFVVSGTGTVTQLTAGGGHRCALILTGGALCWGDNAAAQLGTGNTTNQASPTAVSTAQTFATITAGSLKTCALTTAGRAYCWGFNGSGQLGDGTTITRFTPTLVPAGIAWRQIVSGGNHTCALTGGGLAFCWGLNEFGQLGDGSAVDRSTPQPVQTTLRFRRLMAGTNHTCGLTTANEVYCWGSNSVGQLGIGTVGGTQLLPVRAAPGETFAWMGGGVGLSTCAVRSDGVARCWGSNRFGQLGDGDPNLVVRAPTPVSIGATQTLAVAGSTACAITTTGTTRCWGNGPVLGAAQGTPQYSPVDLQGAGTFKEIKGGTGVMCALALDDRAWCWGNGASGELGNGTFVASATPVQVSGARAFTQLFVGVANACGLTAAGEAWCWGSNSAGQLGNNSTTNSAVPVLVSGGRQWITLTIGGSFACGIEVGGAVYCWGAGAEGRLGTNSTAPELTPRAVSGGFRFTSIGAGLNFACGSVTGGSTYCWGGNAAGQLGDGGFTGSLVPRQMTGTAISFVRLHGASTSMCGLTSAGAAYCWGGNADGQVGIGTTQTTVPVATLVSGGLTWRRVDSGFYNSCGVTTSDVAYCWGMNSVGGVGNNRQWAYPSPVTVTGITLTVPSGLEPQP